MSASSPASVRASNDLFAAMTPEELSELVERCAADVKLQFVESAPPGEGCEELRFRGARIGFLRGTSLTAVADLGTSARLVEQRLLEEYRLRVLADVSSKLALASNRLEICQEAIVGLKKLVDRADSLAIYMPSEDGTFRVVDSQALDGTVAATPHRAKQGHVGY
ncbi:MAG: hypothetical protein WB992_03710, partial [Bryobacteraceae bacterium]